jgi:leucyl/phenylalanyl-tRNA--protein transferase
MASYPVLLGRRLWFPPPDHAPAHGLLAVGGDLSVERLLLAYSMGIFPWYSDETPILWYSPNPRYVLKLDEWHLPARLERTIRSGRFEVRFDSAFKDVITACAAVPRPGQDGTWITEDMKAAYCTLHETGYAHCVEAWRDGRLVGGIYGVSLGRIFFGESMFHTERDASKVALAALVHRLQDRNYHLLDCQQETGHLARFGARAITRAHFLRLLDQGLQYETEVGSWHE